MAAHQILPTDLELARLDTLDAIRTWAGLHQDIWNAVSAFLGTIPSIRVLSLVPLETLRQVPSRLRIPLPPARDGTVPDPRPLTAVEIIQLALMWRISRQAFNLEDIDPLITPVTNPHPTAAGGAGAAVTTTTGRKKIKVSDFVDQLDGTEVEMATQNELEEAYRQYRTVTGAEPQPEADPTHEQISVLFHKVIHLNEAPYADFSVLTPYGRRVQRQMKAKGFFLQQDGSWRSAEVPGPPTFEAWASCWRVYRTILLMMRHKVNAAGDRPAVVSVAALEEYHDKINELNNEFPECWHLIVQAEDRCRAEQFERAKRNLTKALLEGRMPMNIDFRAEEPWNGVFTYMARDSDYWNRSVVRPAQTFIARGGSGKKMTKESAENTQMTDPAIQAVDKESDIPGPSRSAKKRKKQQERLQQLQNELKSFKPWAGGGGQWNASSSHKGDGKSGGHPRKAGREFQTDREGNQICFKFSKGPIGSCKEPCLDGRTHACQLCLGSHPNVSCPNKSKGGKGQKK